ncbi:MAG: DNA polymerase I [Anaerolineales bacterium]|nr:DNA polymerase I [Anaerolineales bacterium]
MTAAPRLFLIDGHALAYRTYFALTGAGGGDRFMTRAGEPTAGTYGFVSVLLRLIEQELPEYLAVSFDTGRTFRDELFPDYKGTREKMPDDLRQQIERIHEVVNAFNIPILEKEGFEADDVLGTVARLAADQNVDVVILTGDRDLLQLATDHISIRLAGQKLSEAKDYAPAEVVERYGLRPDQIVDYKALVGDASDNIPGVRGVGDKTAVSLLQQYETLDSIYEHLEEIPARFRNKLEESRENAYLSQKLALIVEDVPLEFNLEACRVQNYDRERVVNLFRELEFRTLLDRVEEVSRTVEGHQMNLFESSPPPKRSAGSTMIIDTATALENLASRLNAAREIAFDVETTGTDPIRADLVGISLAVEPGEGFYIPVAHKQNQSDAQLPLIDILSAIRPALANPSIPKIGHNLKYDYLVLSRCGLDPAPLAFDTMIAEWLCDPSSRNLGLKNLAWVRLGVEMTPIEALIGKGRGQRTMAQVAIRDTAAYAAADAEICLRLKPILEEELIEKDLLHMFHEIEMPLVPVLAEMERNGIRLDTAFLKHFSEKLQRRLADIQDQIYALADRPFNINSTQQLSDVLFNQLGLTPPDRARKMASGHVSTAASVLEELREAHPIVALVLEQREIAKLQSTYAEALPMQVNPATERIHTSFNQTGSVTGRLASSDPNLQNIPVRTELGREIRRAFIAEKGWALLSVDYSQIELRVVAHMAEDAAMIDAFMHDQDIHAATASAVFGVDASHVDADMRRRAKAINFGLIYGMSAFGLSRSTDLTLAESEQFVQAYFDQFPGVKRYLEETRRKATEEGYVSTLLGRRRYFPQLAPTAQVSEPFRARAQREAVNAPIQGTAADIIKIATIHLAKALHETPLKARILLQVHDELLLECPQEELAATVKLVREIMRDAYALRVPLKTDAKAGATWAEMTPIQGNSR